jgi:hypothetical protein
MKVYSTRSGCKEVNVDAPHYSMSTQLHTALRAVENAVDETPTNPKCVRQQTLCVEKHDSNQMSFAQRSSSMHDVLRCHFFFAPSVPSPVFFAAAVFDQY